MRLAQSRIAAGIIIVGMAVMTIVAWPLIPPGQSIPIHFTITGTPNRFAPRELGLLILPALALLLSFVLGSRRTGNDRGDRVPLFERPLPVIKIVVLAVFFAGQALIIGYALHPVLDISRLFFGALGVLIVVLGAVTSRVKPDAVIGIRTPWTRGDMNVWQATQRFGSAVFMIAGIVLAGTAALLPRSGVLAVVSLADVGVAVLVCTLYSYWEYRLLSGAARTPNPDSATRP